MPRRARPGVTRRRRRHRPGYRRRRRDIARVPRGPMSRSTIVKMRYCDQISLDPAIAGVPAYHYFRCISIHDPDQTGTGHQPLGHDQWAQFYKHYTVLGSKLTCTFVPSGAGALQDSVVAFIRLDKDTTTQPNPTDLTESRDTVYRVVTDSDNGGKVTLSKNFSSKRFFGYNVYKTRDGTGSNFGSDPNRGAYFQIGAFSLSPTQNASVVLCYVTIQYIVQLTEPVDLAQS